MSDPSSLTIVNLWGGPGAGKSTTATGLFNLMKSLGLRVEYVPEVAKDLTYDRDEKRLQNQLLVLAEQDHRLRRLVGEVDWVVTDSPLPLGLAYAGPEYDFLEETVEGAYSRYTNVDFFIRRVKPYHKYGRGQTESQALALDVQIRDLWEDFRDDNPGLWMEVDGDHHAPGRIAEKLGLLEDCDIVDCEHLPLDGSKCALCGSSRRKPDLPPSPYSTYPVG